MIRICLAQINSSVGDIKGNADKIISFIDEARDRDADIIVFPELALSGYPPEDLLMKPHFIGENKAFLGKVAASAKRVLAIVGVPYQEGKAVYNSAALIFDRKIKGIYHKILLPNYGVFDEKRYFTPGKSCPVISLNNSARVGINICEDIWHREGPHREEVRKGGADIIINISASPYHMRKILERQNLLMRRAKELGAWVFYCNLVGGQDELVFDGGSMAFDPKGRMIARAKQFEEDLATVDIEVGRRRRTTPRGAKEKRKVPVNIIEERCPRLEEVYKALVLGMRDYTVKNGFKKVVFGISGGIDSSLLAVILVDSLGPENVTAVSMPSIYTSRLSKEMIAAIAGSLGIKLITVPINAIFDAFLSALKKEFSQTARGIAEENIQARIRGNLLMALSNKFGYLVVSTGNKSELSTGYCTLYGDMAGGFALLKDIPKTLVYELASFANSFHGREIIPEEVFKRPPTAELKDKQRDQDTLPPYPVLDKIIEQYIENDLSAEEISRRGFKKRIVREVVSMIDRNEYKRRQAPIGIKVTPRAFGRDRRMPITNKYTK